MDIAIIGMAGKFPEAGNLFDFFYNLKNGLDAIRPFSFSRISNTGNEFLNYLEYGYLENIDHFDYAFFGLSQAEAEKMDPNQRLLLQISYDIFENAGLKLSEVAGSQTAVFIADKQNHYYRFLQEIDGLALIGNLKSAVAGRISRFFDLRGSSMMVDSACSSSLVAINLACQDLILGNCLQALVCASEINVTPLTKDFEGVGVISKSFRCKSFSADADGIGLGEMVGGVLLKPLENAIADNNQILAVIKGASINQDASLSSSLTAPNTFSQQEVILSAWAKAKIIPSEISYVEAHGTGTKLGDPIEIKALSSAFSKFTTSTGFCAVSSVKTNIGHTDGASGMAGLIKVVLSLKYRQLFPSLFFETPNPFIDFSKSAVYVNSKLNEWRHDSKQVRTAAISSFSIMGTNAHMVLQEYTTFLEQKTNENESFTLIVFSARSQKSLHAYSLRLKGFLEENGHLAINDIGYSLLKYKNLFEYRFSALVSGVDDLISQLSEFNSEKTLKKPARIILIMSYNEKLDRGMVDIFRRSFPFFSSLLANLYKDIPIENHEDVRVVNLVFQYCMAKMLDYQGIKTRHHLLDNFGKNVAALIKDETLISEVVQKILNLNDKDLDFNIERLYQFTESIGDALLVDLSNGKIGQALADYQKNNNFRYVKIDYKVTRCDLRQFYSDLFNAGADLIWENISFFEGQRIDLPTYAFEPNRCWGTEPSGIDVTDYLFDLTWIDQPISESVDEIPHKWLFVGAKGVDDISFGFDFDRRYERIFVSNSSEYKKLSDALYLVNFDSEYSFLQLFSETGIERTTTGVGIVFCCYIQPEVKMGSLDEILRYQYNLAKACLHLDKKLKLELIVCTKCSYRVNGSESGPLKFQQSIAHGFVASASEEMPWVKMKAIDIDESSLPSIGKLIIDECRQSHPLTIAYRNGKRFIKEIRPVTQKVDVAFKLKYKGVYIITGSPKGIGLEVAKWFASQEVVRIIFIGRSTLSDKKLWQNINREHPDFPFVFALKQLELANAEVKYYTTDLSNEKELSETLKQIRITFGTIDGVIHSAGVPGDNLLKNHSWLDFYSPFLPKMKGLLNLSRYLENDSLSFFVNFSSLDSLVGSAGNTNYSAANSFLDSYVYSLREKGINAITINWPAWQETGMWYRAFGQNQATSEINQHTISNSEGISALKYILRAGDAHTVVSKERPEKYSGKWFSFRKNDYYEDESTLQKNFEGSEKSISVNLEQRSTAAILAAIWMDVLKANEISENSDFFDLGGHSLHAARLFNRIEGDLSIRLEFDDLLEYSTIKSLSNFIELKKRQQIKEKAVALPKVISDGFPLSSTQKGIWIVCQEPHESVTYNEVDVFEWKGKLNLDAFRRSLEIIVENYEILRTTFGSTGENVFQYISQAGNLDFEFIDLSGELSPQTVLENYVDSAGNYVFDLSNGPLCYFKVFKKSDELYVLLFNFHHIICDRYSQQVFISIFTTCYRAIEQGRVHSIESKFNFKDYSLEQSRVYYRHETNDYWERTLGEWHSQTHLLHRNNDELSHQAGSMSFELNNFCNQQINEFCKRFNVTPFVIFYATLSAFFSRYTRQESTVFGSVVHGRGDSKLAEQIGPFVNTILLIDKIDIAHSFSKIIKICMNSIMQAIANQDYPYERIVGHLRQARQLDVQSFFDVMLLFEDSEGETFIIDGGCEVSRIEIAPVHTKCNLTITLRKNMGAYSVSAVWKKSMYDENTIRKFSSNFQILLESVLADPAKPICLQPMITNEEIALIRQWNDTTFNLPYKGLVEMFYVQTTVHGSRPAVVFNGQSMTYSELWFRAGKVKDRILSHKGTMDTPIVALMTNRGFEMMVGIWGILRAGLAYMPIDPSLPTNRIKFLIEDSAVKIVVADRKECFHTGALWLNLIDWPDINSSPEKDDVARTEDSLTYVIYTSGSTGIPKGVMVEDAGVVNRIEWMWRHYDFNMDDVVLQKTPYTFDVSVWEIFMTLCFGGKLILCPKEYIFEPTLVARLILEEKVTTIHFVPSMYNAFLWSLSNDDIPNLRTLRHVVLSGEALKKLTVSSHFEKLKIPLHNLYGPTEASVDVTFYEVSQQDFNIPIGVPISNIKISILDDNLNPVPIGAVGIICISGVGLARGYLNRPELTDKSFQNSNDGQSRVYITGDLGRFRPDGVIEFLGRNDHQVKLRGNRVELGEIENLVMNHGDIMEAVAIVNEGMNNESELIVFYTGQEIKPEILREWMGQRAPDYLLPSRFIYKETFPFTSSGKIDRKALSGEATRSNSDEVAVSTPLKNAEIELAELWKKVLGNRKINSNDNFLLIGGDSIKVIRLCALINQQFNTQVSFSQFLTNPTIAKLAPLIIKQQQNTLHSDGIIIPTNQKNFYDLSPGQKRLWILSQIEVDQRGYIISCTYDIEGRLNVNALKNSFRDIVLKHEILRTTFQLIDDEVKQCILPVENFSVSYFDLSRTNDREEGRIKIRDNFNKPFDLAAELLFKVILLKLEDNKYSLGIAMHHIVSDAWSIDILTKELAGFYNSYLLEDANIALEMPRIQYKDYAEWLHHKLLSNYFETEKIFWSEYLAGVMPKIRLPYDFERSMVRGFTGDCVTIHLDSKTLRPLAGLAQSGNTTLFVALLTVIKTFLYKYSGDEDIILGVPVADRENIETENCIGFFVNTIPVRSFIERGSSFKENLNIVSKSFVAALGNKQLPFNEIIDLINPHRDRSRTALFDVLVSLEEDSLGSLRGMEGLNVTKHNVDAAVSQFDLSFEFVSLGHDTMDLNVRYASDVFKKDTIQMMVDNLGRWFDAVAENDNKAIRSLSCLCEEHQGLLVTFNKTNCKKNLPSIIELFEKNVQHSPERIAIVCEGYKTSYKDLDKRVNGIASFLREKGVKPNVVVGVLMKPCEDLIASILGILKSGAAYLALDHEYPADRLQYCLTGSGAVLLIGNRLGYDFDIPTFAFEKILDNKKVQETYDRIPVPKIGDLAYVMFTSGSTGRPKGVMVNHAAISKYIHDSGKLLGITETDRVVQQSSVSFDASVEEIFTTLCFGATLLMLPYGGKDIEGLIDLIVNEEATVVLPTPLVLNELNKNYEKIPSVRVLASGGDRLLASHVNNFIGEKRIINVYGPTETTVAVTFQEICDLQDLNTIGKPFDGDFIYILDKDLNQVPVGVEGIIYIGGECLALGYCDGENERFIQNPFVQNQKLFNTGDLGKWTKDGRIIFIGRNDTQTKIRGYRVELSEVERAITSIPGVNGAKVGIFNRHGEDLLIAYVAGLETSKELELRNELHKTLPPYMIPNKFVVMEKLPMNNNHKVDYNKLEKLLYSDHRSHESTTPKNDVERIILNAWTEVLHADELNTSSNFFEMGGNSIKLLKLYRILDNKFKSKISVGQLFSNTTIETQALLITQDDKQSSAVPPREIEF